ncbi:MFS general substrate transporter [Wallemia mellicola]|uniref:MFS general substrate transporter n=1 Tax=Wallemia mellicola TaxID=1708541 RepID=A0A4T0T633_9BASI|nr:MFS general substrate transporter [Wallemia mellicola]TIC03751.1 MFS general substrate transporter [Wallemia mellicola]TIC04983.1 MFS general substrate transporter [Wallemia mellicola]TIC08302.1 MFS general substrate transporter [Wallemia mellicola]TIC12239.1 MFS general substrate transporter [Wallemia mellicola]
MKKQTAFTEKVDQIPQQQQQSDSYDYESQSQRTSTDVSSKKRRWSFSSSSIRSAGERDNDPDVVSNRKLVWKMDMAIMPLAVLLYLMAYLDRGNLGNAKNFPGFEETVLDGEEDKYSLLSSIFYISYLVMQVPLTLLAKFMKRPDIMIGFVAIVWGISSTLQATEYNYAGALACRFFLGFSEAGFGPLMPFYFSLFYVKNEMGFRTTVFIAAAPIAGAFSGIIAYGIEHIHSYIASWRILFLVEGLPSIVLGILVILILPSRIENTKWFNEEERAKALARKNTEMTQEKIGYVNWRHVLSGFTDFRTYLNCAIYMAINIALSSISNFLPQILTDLGYHGADAQLYSVPPYVCAGGWMIILSIFSDRYEMRGPFISVNLLISGVGYAMLLGLPTVGENALKARYGGIFLAVMGTYTAIPLTLSWSAANAGSESKKAVAIAMLNTIGHTLSVLGGYIYPDSEGPAYTRGYAICMAFAFWGSFLAATHTFILWQINKKRDKKEGVVEHTPDTFADADKAVGGFFYSTKSANLSCRSDLGICFKL